MKLTRRDFVKTTVVAGAAAGAGGLAASGCGNDVEPPPVLRLPVVSGNKVQVAVAMYPNLVRKGGAVTIKLDPLPPNAPTDKLLLIHYDDRRYVATSAICPHAGCPLGYSAHDQLIECPCHGSRFRAVADPNDMTTCPGQVVHLPARGDLSAWLVQVDVGPSGDETVTIDLDTFLCNSLPPVTGGQVTLGLDQFTMLGMVGGWIKGRPAGLADKLIIIRLDDQTVVALSDICTHMQCDVECRGMQGDLFCPCHGSTYNPRTGAVTGGPAPRALKQYATTFDGQTVVVRVS